MDEPEAMNAAVESGRVVDFPMRTFIDEGLLHHFNRAAFWPLGLMLTAERYPTEREVYRAGLVSSAARMSGTPEVRRALADTVIGPHIAILSLDGLATAIFENMRAEGTAVDVLRLRQYEPPERVVSGLSAEAQEERRVAAAVWLAKRGRTIAP